MTNNNRRIGNSFERRLCLSLSDYGFWSHNLAQNSSGQPFDVMAARNGKTYPIDCKVCTNNTFNMERIEENQFCAMTLWRETGNGEGWFAMELNDGTVYMLSLSHLEAFIADERTTLSERFIKHGFPLQEWVRLCK